MGLGDLESVKAKREARELLRAEAQLLAAKAWADATENQKTGIRFGMTDVDLFRSVGLDPYKPGDLGHEFTLALMDCASRDGGMRA